MSVRILATIRWLLDFPSAYEVFLTFVARRSREGSDRSLAWSRAVNDLHRTFYAPLTVLSLALSLSIITLCVRNAIEVNPRKVVIGVGTLGAFASWIVLRLWFPQSCAFPAFDFTPDELDARRRVAYFRSLMIAVAVLGLVLLYFAKVAGLIVLSKRG